MLHDQYLLYLGSGDNLKNAIHKIVERSLSSINESIFKRTASQTLAQVALQGPQDTPATPAVYTNGNHQAQYTNPVSATADPVVAASGQAYTGLPGGATYAYGNGTPASVPQTTGGFEQQTYHANQDTAMTPSHAAALQAAASGATTQRPGDTYPYGNSQVATNGHQPAYTNTDVGAHGWQQWTRQYMQQVAPQGEYLNTATTLMSLGGREGHTQGPGQNAQGAVEGSVMQGPGVSTMQWPGVQFGMQTNGHVGQQ